MNIRKLAIALSFIAAAGSAWAVEAEQWNPPPSTANRADVQADLRHAAANGELVAQQGEAYGSFDYKHLPASTLTRAQVKQDLARARANGELPVVNEAYSGFIEPQVQGARKLVWHERLHAHPAHQWFRSIVAQSCAPATSA